MALMFPRSIRCAGEVSQARDDAPVSAIMVSMSDDYKGLLRRVIGEPTVSSALWGVVTSVSEGDEDAYADALVAIGREFGYYCLEPVIKDWCTPGVVLETLLGRYPTVDSFWRLIAKHPSVTANVERLCRQKRSVKLNEALAASPGVSDETVKRFLRSKSSRVIGALLGNDALGEDVLRRARARAQEVGMYICYVVSSGKRNASMPVDIVESWLSCPNEQARLEALESPVAPRNILWERLRKTRFDQDSSVGMSIFNNRSNADGGMIDWYLSRWEEQVSDELQSDVRVRVGGQWTAELALTHPRARAGTLERLYARYGNVNMWACKTVAKDPSSPDWVRRDATRRLADAGLAHLMMDSHAGVSSESVRALYGCGYATAAADCENAPGDLLVDVLEGKLRAAAEAQMGGSFNASGFSWNDVAAALRHRNMLPEVRRECARWLPELLWLVARDGFLGRV